MGQKLCWAKARGTGSMKSENNQNFLCQPFYEWSVCGAMNVLTNKCCDVGNISYCLWRFWKSYCIIFFVTTQVKSICCWLNHVKSLIFRHNRYESARIFASCFPQVVETEVRRLAAQETSLRVSFSATGW